MTFLTPFLRTAMVCAGALAAPILHAQLVTPPVHAQITATAAPVVGYSEDERFDISGSAAYGHFNPGYAHQVRATNLEGYQGSFTAWITHRFGAEATLRGLYGNYQIPSNVYNVPTGSSRMSETLFLFGPSFRLYNTQRYTLGMHALVGGTYGIFNNGYAGTGVQPYQIGVYNNQLASAYSVGGWGDYKLTDKWAVRVTADYQPTRYSKIGQNEPFVAAGIVYKWGRRK